MRAVFSSTLESDIWSNIVLGAVASSGYLLKELNIRECFFRDYFYISMIIKSREKEIVLTLTLLSDLTQPKLHQCQQTE
jgi:hypothetical protein